MFTLPDSARVTLSPGTYWNHCDRCGALFAATPEQGLCRGCDRPAAVDGSATRPAVDLLGGGR